MTDTTALDELIKSVEAGHDWHGGIDFMAARWLGLPPCHVNDAYEFAMRAYNGSLDAAKALHDALLPRVMWQRGPTGQFCLLDTYSEEIGHSFGIDDNPARAWLLAILRAYRAQIGSAA